MSDIQRISGISGLNPITEHELWRDHDPFKEIGEFGLGIAKSVAENSREIRSKTAARMVNNGESYDEARNAVIAERQKEYEDVASFGDIVMLIILSPFLLLSAILGDE